MQRLREPRAVLGHVESDSKLEERRLGPRSFVFEFHQFCFKYFKNTHLPLVNMSEAEARAGQEEVAAESGPSYEILPNGHKKYPRGQDPRLRYRKPYWWPYRTFVKERWIGRELLEVVSTEFRDRSVEYYVSASALRRDRASRTQGDGDQY